MFEERFLLGLTLALAAGCDGTPASGDGAGGATGGAGGASGGAGATADARDDAIDGSGGRIIDASVGIVGDDDDGTVPLPWIEVWRDDFRGPRGDAPDPAKWNIEVNARPDNSELQYYTARRENTYLDGNGHLVLQALEENFMGSQQPYTSGRINTHRHFEQTYGRFEARIKLPAGRGLWPAFWLLGANIDQVSWPACGEIDIMEEAGSSPSVTHGSLHGTSLNLTGTYAIPGKLLSDAFHVYALEWTPESVTWFLDDVAYQTFTRQDIMAKGMSWGLDHPFFILLNLAVGGIFDGPPTRFTEFPARLYVDRVTVGRLPDMGNEAGSDAGFDGEADSDAHGD